MCFNMNELAFEYSDTEYFDWFRANNEEHFKAVIQWKGLNRNNLFDRIMAGNWWASWNENNQMADVHDEELNNHEWLVTRAFLRHLNEPIEYPILDVNVFRAMRTLSQQLDLQWHEETNRNIGNWQRDYIGGYKEFFHWFYQQHNAQIQVPAVQGVNEQIVRRRVLDRAIWEYGRLHG